MGKTWTGTFETLANSADPDKMLHLIRVCTDCKSYRKLRVKWNCLKFLFRIFFPSQRQLSHQYCQCFDFAMYLTQTPICHVIGCHLEVMWSRQFRLCCSLAPQPSTIPRSQTAWILSLPRSPEVRQLGSSVLHDPQKWGSLASQPPTIPRSEEYPLILFSLTEKEKYFLSNKFVWIQCQSVKIISQITVKFHIFQIYCFFHLALAKRKCVFKHVQNADSNSSYACAVSAGHLHSIDTFYSA